ncbi:hypothetical protein [Pedobacter rhodius]|uniref:GyrI-like small molecule binding domain-containing protein n=1 Tax=Pedobacter rhodius TaxID=3004098 RepID=A0ABT4KSJ3_9SPHI|nr:hypothetical protein [Pedobacter sp. SJ11]MCZ4221902.1 hypothetical protein [Pedobacter sp. SJ11]
MNNKLIIQNKKAFQAFMVTALAVTTTWIFIRRFHKNKHVLVPGEIGLDKERYRFQIPQNKKSNSIELERRGSSFAIRVEGKYLGRVFRKGNSWVAKGRALKPYLDVIIRHLSNPGSRHTFSDVLCGVYPEIESTTWKTDETLEVIVNENTDLEVFTTFLRDELPNLAEFDEHIDLIVKKPTSNYFILLPVN